MGECRGRSAVMGLFIVPGKIGMDHRQPPRDIDLGAGRDDFAEQDADRDAQRDELDLRDEIFPGDHAMKDIKGRENELYDDEK